MLKAKLEVVIRTIEERQMPRQTITRYFTTDGRLICEKITGEVQQTLSEDKPPSAADCIWRVNSRIKERRDMDKKENKEIFENRMAFSKQLFAKRLKDLMSIDTTQQQLAKFLNVTRQAVSLYLNGAVLPPVEKLVEIANYFMVTTDYLLGLTDEKTIVLR